LCLVSIIDLRESDRVNLEKFEGKVYVISFKELKGKNEKIWMQSL